MSALYIIYVVLKVAPYGFTNKCAFSEEARSPKEVFASIERTRKKIEKRGGGSILKKGETWNALAREGLR